MRGKKGGGAWIGHRFNVATPFWCVVFEELRRRWGPCAVLLLHRETSAQTTNGAYPFEISIRAVNIESVTTPMICVCLTYWKGTLFFKPSITHGASRLSKIQRSLCWATTTLILLHTLPFSPFFNKYWYDKHGFAADSWHGTDQWQRRDSWRKKHSHYNDVSPQGFSNIQNSNDDCEKWCSFLAVSH